MGCYLKFLPALRRLVSYDNLYDRYYRYVSFSLFFRSYLSISLSHYLSFYFTLYSAVSLPLSSLLIVYLMCHLKCLNEIRVAPCSLVFIARSMNEIHIIQI